MCRIEDQRRVSGGGEGGGEGSPWISALHSPRASDSLRLILDFLRVDRSLINTPASKKKADVDASASPLPPLALSFQPHLSFLLLCLRLSVFQPMTQPCCYVVVIQRGRISSHSFFSPLLFVFSLLLHECIRVRRCLAGAPT